MKRVWVGVLGGLVIAGQLAAKDPVAKKQPSPAAATPQVLAAIQTAETVHVRVGSGNVLTFPSRVMRVAVGDEKIVALHVVESRQVLIQGLTPGRSTVFAWLADGRRLRYDLVVSPRAEVLEEALHHLDPRIVVDASPDSATLILSGKVDDEHVANQARQLAEAMYSTSGGAGTSHVVSLLQFPGSNDADLRLTSALAAVDPRIRLRRIQVGPKVSNTADAVVLEGRVKDISALVRAITLAELQLGGVGGKIEPLANELPQGGRNRNFSGSSGLQRLQGSDEPPSGLAAYVARGLILKSASGRVLSFLEVDQLPQIMVSIRVLQVDRSRARRLGIDYRLDGSGFSVGSFHQPGRTSMPAPAKSGAAQTIDGLTGGNIVATFVDKALAVAAAIDFLQDNDVARSVAEPNITTLSGESASVLIGGEVPIPTTTVSTSTAVQGFLFQDFGVRLDIRPTLAPNGLVAMEISPSIIKPSADLAVSGVPGFQVQSVQTTAKVAPGQTLVLGGLISFNDEVEKRGVPGLSEIPLMKHLFSWEGRTLQEQEILFVITPRILSEGPEEVAEAIQWRDVEPLAPGSVVDLPPADVDSRSNVAGATIGRDGLPPSFTKSANRRSPGSGSSQGNTDAPPPAPPSPTSSSVSAVPPSPSASVNSPSPPVKQVAPPVEIETRTDAAERTAEPNRTQQQTVTVVENAKPSADSPRSSSRSTAASVPPPQVAVVNEKSTPAPAAASGPVENPIAQPAPAVVQSVPIVQERPAPPPTPAVAKPSPNEIKAENKAEKNARNNATAAARVEPPPSHSAGQTAPQTASASLATPLVSPATSQPSSAAPLLQANKTQETGTTKPSSSTASQPSVTLPAPSPSAPASKVAVAPSTTTSMTSPKKIETAPAVHASTSLATSTPSAKEHDSERSAGALPRQTIPIASTTASPKKSDITTPPANLPAARVAAAATATSPAPAMARDTEKSTVALTRQNTPVASTTANPKKSDTSQAPANVTAAHVATTSTAPSPAPAMTREPEKTTAAMLHPTTPIASSASSPSPLSTSRPKKSDPTPAPANVPAVRAAATLTTAAPTTARDPERSTVAAPRLTTPFASSAASTSSASSPLSTSSPKRNDATPAQAGVPAIHTTAPIATAIPSTTAQVLSGPNSAGRPQQATAITSTQVNPEVHAWLTRDYQITVIVSPHEGDSWTRLSKRLTGDARHWQELARLNGAKEVLTAEARVRVPFEMIRPDLQQEIIEKLLPKGSAAESDWKRMSGHS